MSWSRRSTQARRAARSSWQGRRRGGDRNGDEHRAREGTDCPHRGALGERLYLPGEPGRKVFDGDRRADGDRLVRGHQGDRLGAAVEEVRARTCRHELAVPEPLGEVLPRLVVDTVDHSPLRRHAVDESIDCPPQVRRPVSVVIEQLTDNAEPDRERCLDGVRECRCHLRKASHDVGNACDRRHRRFGVLASGALGGRLPEAL